MKSITLYIYTQNNIARNNREISSPLTHISIFIVFIIFYSNNQSNDIISKRSSLFEITVFYYYSANY